MITKHAVSVLFYQRSHPQRCYVSEDPIRRYLKRERVAIGRNVVSLRDQQDVRQDALAHRAGISVRHMSRIETGSASVGIDKYLCVAKALGVPLYWLFTTDWPRLAEQREADRASGPGSGEGRG